MSSPSTGAQKASILRLRAGLLLLIGFVLLCASGGSFVARQFGLGWGWAILIAIVIWVGVGIALARVDARIYFGIALTVTVLLAYLVYDFSASALEWPTSVSLVLAVAATALLAFTFYDFRRLKDELRVWVYRR
ncbi:hypothetical protein [Xanthobacter agilis]|uniref:Chromate transport protein ChrA n=1 Tax=Xanthobacter agilis TaxID=47492 RepID=A0ABU0LE83_XANAG|nr:hypothetical protein [Xanthobacter agilis]MDQ0505443.1 chromate transport protein ChrA [Xanthobacter agilis]